MKTTRFFNNVEQKWVLIDAQDKVLGRLATRIAKILMGKTKPIYTPNAICGDRVVVVNARQIRLTGAKELKKVYDRYSGYPSGRREINAKALRQKNPSKILYLAVKGMLPKNNLGARMLKSLRIYPDSTHEQAAQKPEPISV